MYNIYIKQVASMKGVTATREIFEKAIDELPDEQVKLVFKKIQIIINKHVLVLIIFLEKYVNVMRTWNVNLVK